jgi:hypothetical protein
MRSIIFSSLLLAFSSLAFGQDKTDTSSEEAAIKKTIDQFFEGMRKGDSTLVRSCLHKSARFQTCFTDKSGNPMITEDNVHDFITAVGTPHEDVWNEKITSMDIRVDAQLAQVWTDYSFYLNDQFSHCGVNAFQLFKEQSGWKIIQITDTRRKDKCNK